MSPEDEAKSPPICDYEGSDYQSTFWDQGGRAYEDQVEAIALRRLLPPEGKLLLELGAGAGRNTPRYHNFQRVVLLDYSRSQLQQAQERLGANSRYLYVAADAYHLPFDPGLFDTATMIRVLHHMADPQRAIEQVRAVLRPEGVFILEFASKRHLKAILRYALRQQSWNPFTRESVEIAPLNFDFHPAAIQSWLQAAGFTTERQLTVSHFRLDALKRLFPLPLLVALDALAQHTGELWQLTPSVFVKARADKQGPLAAPGTFFRCPSCGQPITASLPDPFGPDTALANQDLPCSACDQTWRILDGIYDFKRDNG